MRSGFLVFPLLVALTAQVLPAPAFAESTPARVMVETDEVDTRAILTHSGDVLIYDLVYAGPNSVSGHVAGRFLRDIARLPRSTQFSEVNIAYLGEVRFRVPEGDMRRLVAGFKVGDMSLFQKMMQLPSIVRSTDGTRIYPVHQGGSLAAMNARAEDFNNMLRRWYLSDLLVSMPVSP